jgi:hypothetical protein
MFTEAQMLGVVLAGAILAAGADPAPQAAAPAPAAAKPPAKDPNALVCRSEQIPGSRLSNKVCMTAAEAARRQAADRQGLNSAQVQSGKPADAMMMTPH